MVTISKAPVFGIVEPKPFRGLPEGRARLQVRPEDWVRVFVKTPAGIRGFHAIDEGDTWIPAYEFGRNETISQ